MPEDGSELEARVAALERALTDGREGNVAELPEGAAVEQRLDGIERRLADLEERLDELDAGLQAVQGYIGEVEHVNREIERQAEAALAAVQRIEDDRGGSQPATDRSTREPEPDSGTRVEAGPEGEHRPGSGAGRVPERGAGTDGTGVEEGSAGGGGIGAWPPADDAGPDDDADRDRRDRDDEVDPGDVLSRVRDAL
jgi:TolA-binding protein